MGIIGKALEFNIFTLQNGEETILDCKTTRA